MLKGPGRCLLGLFFMIALVQTPIVVDGGVIDSFKSLQGYIPDVRCSPFRYDPATSYLILTLTSLFRSQQMGSNACAFSM